jgi:hypothetical protein
MIIRNHGRDITLDLHRRLSVRRGAIAELAMGIGANNVDSATRFEKHRMTISRIRGHNVCHDLHDRLPVRHASISQGAVVIAAHSVDSKISCEEHGAVVSCVDKLCRNGWHGYRGGRGGRGGGRCNGTHGDLCVSETRRPNNYVRSGRPADLSNDAIVAFRSVTHDSVIPSVAVA